MSEKIFSDLHNHTTASDGDFSPEALVEMAALKHISVIGITDHDTLAGLEAALSAGKRFNVKVIPGVEVSVRFKRAFFTGTLHLLVYFNPKRLSEPGFVSSLSRILAKGRGQELVRARIDEINAVFGPGKPKAMLHREMIFRDIESLSSNASRRHFAIALEQEFNVTDKADINTIIGNASPAYLPSGIELSDISGFIRDNHVVAALAHPAAGSFPGEGHYKEVLPPVEVVEQILPEFLDAGVNGLEVYYPGHTDDHIQLMLEWADRYDLMVTGGSDCHDDTDRPLGVSGLPRDLTRKLTDYLLEV